jgi:hypothetical protein
MKLISIKTVFVFLIFTIFLSYIGCDDSGVINPPPPLYRPIEYYNNIIISSKPLLSAFNSIDLYRGVIVQEVSSYKDAVFIDSAQIKKKFYFNSGNLSGFGGGFKTQFIDYIYTNIPQFCFDSITVIPDLDILTNDDFKFERTGSFSDSIEVHPVFGFYLAGKYITGVTSKPVYGLIYVDSTWRSEQDSTLSLRFDVKINKEGNNKFRY